MQCVTARAHSAVELLHWAVELLHLAMELLHCTASLPWLVGNGTPATHCLIAWGQWAVQILQCTATPLGDSGKWNSCNARAQQVGGRGVLPRRWFLP